MVKSTNAQLRMFDQTTSDDSLNATSSPALVDGATPYDALDGPMIGTSGPEVVPVSRGRQRGRALRPTIRATFGLRGSSSSASAALASSLVNRLRGRLDGRGSTVFAMTWKRAVTPSGRSISRLAASERRTGDNACGSWPTTTKEDGRSSARHGYMVTGNQGTTLLDAARMATWPTPRAEDSESTGAHRGRPDTLTSAARVATWATP